MPCPDVNTHPPAHPPTHPAQLISRVCHANKDVSDLTKAIICKILDAYPQQVGGGREGGRVEGILLRC